MITFILRAAPDLATDEDYNFLTEARARFLGVTRKDGSVTVQVINTDVWWEFLNEQVPSRAIKIERTIA